MDLNSDEDVLEQVQHSTEQNGRSEQVDQVQYMMVRQAFIKWPPTIIPLLSPLLPWLSLPRTDHPDIWSTHNPSLSLHIHHTSATLRANCRAGAKAIGRMCPLLWQHGIQVMHHVIDLHHRHCDPRSCDLIDSWMHVFVDVEVVEQVRSDKVPSRRPNVERLEVTQ